LKDESTSGRIVASKWLIDWFVTETVAPIDWGDTELSREN